MWCAADKPDLMVLGKIDSRRITIDHQGLRDLREVEGLFATGRRMPPSDAAEPATLAWWLRVHWRCSQPALPHFRPRIPSCDTWSRAEHPQRDATKPTGSPILAFISESYCDTKETEGKADIKRRSQQGLLAPVGVMLLKKINRFDRSLILISR
jgi:hypothetical protein